MTLPDDRQQKKDEIRTANDEWRQQLEDQRTGPPGPAPPPTATPYEAEPEDQASE